MQANRRISWLLVLFTLCSTLSSLHISVANAQSAPAGTACTQPRVRRSWDSYNQIEKDLYVSALQLAMERGLHQKFVQMHVEWFSELEAHRNCMFIYWHRMYLLGYENMLRSLGPGFECVTLPVWDHVASTAKRTSGACSNMEGCAPIISDFGGSTTGVSASLKVYNVTIPTTAGRCITKAPAYSFCGNNTKCAHCIIRGSVSTTTYPAEAYFGSVYQQMFTYSSWANFATSIENGVHNTVHSALRGIMMYFQSPIDPLFYSHHSFIDALQTIYTKCQLGSETATLSASAKVTSTALWANCSRRAEGVKFFAPNVYKVTDEVRMSVQDYAGKWVKVNVATNNLLYKYFKDLPKKFADYVDAKDLGVYSYTYELAGGMKNMFDNCQASNTISSASLLADDGENGDSLEDTAADSETHRWAVALYESARLSGYTEDAAKEQMEMVTCLHKHECLGEVKDYDPVFRANFRVEGHPRCFTLVNALESGEKVIGIPRWRKITSRFVPCPNKKKAKAKKIQEQPVTTVTNITTTTSTTTVSVSASTE